MSFAPDVYPRKRRPNRSAVFSASYEATCGQCCRAINVGDPICYWRPKFRGPVHAECRPPKAKSRSTRSPKKVVVDVPNNPVSRPIAEDRQIARDQSGPPRSPGSRRIVQDRHEAACRDCFLVHAGECW